MAKMINNRMIYLKTVRLSTTKVKLSRMMNIKIVIRTKKKTSCLTTHSTQALVTLVKWNNHQTMKKLSTKKIRKKCNIDDRQQDSTNDDDVNGVSDPTSHDDAMQEEDKNELKDDDVDYDDQAQQKEDIRTQDTNQENK